MNIGLIILIIVMLLFIMRNDEVYMEDDLLSHYLSYPYSSYGRHSKGRKAVTKNTLERYLRVNGKCSSCRKR
jgi:hypothetical protein